MVNPESLNRAIKMALDNGEVSTVEEAEELFAGYRLAIAVGPEMKHSPSLQAALLTGCRYSELTHLRASAFNPDSGTIAIRPNVAEADVVVDGKPVSRGTWAGSLPPGKHRVEVSAEGIEGMEQVLPAFQPCGANGSRPAHVLQWLPGVPSAHAEWLMLEPGIIGPFPVRLVTQADVWGDGRFASAPSTWETWAASSFL